MPFSYIASAVGINAGLGDPLGITGGGGSGSGSGSSGAYDPYASYRPQAAKDLNTLVNNPYLAMSDPGYQQQLKQGITTSQRGAAATGNLLSGGESAALESMGQNTFGSYYNSKIANLMQLSGASQSPASANMAAMQGANINSMINQRNMQNLVGGVGAANAIYNKPVSSYDASNYGYYGGGMPGTNLSGTGQDMLSSSYFGGTSYGE